MNGDLTRRHGDTERGPVIATSFPLPDEALGLLGEVGTVAGPHGWRDALGEAAALLCLLTDTVDAALLESAPRLRIVANAVVGFNHVDVAACRARGIVVTNTPDVLTAATAELAWALLLAAVRRLPQAERSLRAGEFHGWGFWDYLGDGLEGRTLGIYGMGRIGRAVARRAGGFGMRVIYHSRTPLPADEERALDAERVSFGDLLARGDVISLHAPLTPETRHAFGRDALARMRPGSVLVNTARGPLVDEAALADALRDGPLAAAGLDVYEHEPAVHPGLLELPNVVLLPHIGSATRGTRTAMAMLAARNVHAVLSGHPPLTPI
ncbi:MAG: D-3-phosphoglycerate dehydrogenase [uncultured Gemmatimonadetes bacterium]|uniref:D-3-phosphoglycerate dehydrogenase n=1 Tax=uncultured Gemmatimonadota bacterium TaxID=203437 RepID=A0A6J4LCF2_9BACT|nr:MAG: D-3-phosphoglycerate dehydrogenase [uncultured Gemmatimonadota bacterium]